MSTDIGAYNLDKDKRVLGKPWLSTYGSYFSDPENIQLFVDAAKSRLPDRELDILYVASASGLLGEALIHALGKGTLTIVDISQKHLNENTNSHTTKICADLLEMDLAQQFDVVIMRSSLDYFPSRKLQVNVLQIIKKHMKRDGIFINQPAYISNSNDCDLMSRAYNSNDKIGKRLFQSKDIGSIYVEAGFSIPEVIGQGKILQVNEQDHIDRYGITTQEIHRIQDILKSCKTYATVTESGYTMKFEFPIFLATLAKS